MPYIPRAICAKCNHEMRPVANGETLEAVLTDRGPVPVPYYKIAADRFECGKCGTEAYVGFANQPLAEHFHDNYDRFTAARRFTFR